MIGKAFWWLHDNWHAKVLTGVGLVFGIFGIAVNSVYSISFGAFVLAYANWRVVSSRERDDGR